MVERTIKKLVPDPQNPKRKISGTVVKILRAEEPFSYAYLEDGTTLTTRMSFIEAVRLDGRWNNEGQPIYTVTQNATIIISAPDELMRKEDKDKHVQ